jgi:hypothetical protein
MTITTPNTPTRCHLARLLLLLACVWLASGCGAGQGSAGRPEPGPQATEVGIDTGSASSADTARDAGSAPSADTARDGGSASSADTARDGGSALVLDAGIPVLARGVARGAFIEIQEGDYFHIVIRDRAGSVQSFFIAPELAESAWEPFRTSRHRGKPVEVAWDEVFVYIPESGTEELIRRATAIQLIE